MRPAESTANARRIVPSGEVTPVFCEQAPHKASAAREKRKDFISVGLSKPVKSKESFESGQAFDGREFDDLVIGDAVDAERVLRRQGLDRSTVRGAAENDAAVPGILRPRTEKRPCGILTVELIRGCAARCRSTSASGSL